MNKVIAIPVSVGSVTIHVAKGRRWSVVEHLLLDAVCQEPRSAEALSAASSLPLRMVIEALIALMRAGWVELSSEGTGSRFQATAGGKSHVGAEDLPVVTRLVRRPVKYAVEEISGTVLRYRDLDFVWASRFRLMNMAEQVDAVVDATAALPDVNQVAVIRSMLHDDEEFRGLVPSSARRGEGYALVQVTNGSVRGLTNASPALSDALLAIAQGSGTSGRAAMRDDVRVASPTFPPRHVTFSNEDMILGGDAHKALLTAMIGAANASIVIHSTFIGGGSSEEIVDMLAQAGRRGARVDILWGKSDDPDGANATREACAHINARMKRAGLEQFVRAHPFSTESHAKIIVADDGKGAFVAAIGSCNWLSTGFASFEASVRATDPLLVSDIMEVLGQMAMSVTGLNGGIASFLAGQAINIRKRTSPHPGRRANARIVLGGEHAACILQARDDARSHIVLGSHRMGRSANNLSIRPTRAAVDASGVDATFYYGRLSDGMTAEQAAELSIVHGAAGMRIRAVTDPRMHAKFVAWDDGDVVITSHNLLSADTSADFAEIGIHIRAAGAGRAFRERLQQAFRS